MRNVVKVFAPTVTTDNTGQETYSYSFARSIFASYERDSFAKNETGFVQASGHETITFTTRFTPDIGYNHRLEFNGLMYRITAVDNFMNLRHELRLKCTAVDL